MDTVIAITSEDLSAVRELRGDVLGWSEHPLDSETATNVRHFVARTADGDVVACGSCALVAFPDDNEVRFGDVRAMRFWGVTVHPEWRGRQLGTAIMGAIRNRALEQQNVRLVWGQARTTALSFYEGIGYEVVGSEFTAAVSGLTNRRVVLDFFDLSL